MGLLVSYSMHNQKVYNEIEHTIINISQKVYNEIEHTIINISQKVYNEIEHTIIYIMKLPIFSTYIIINLQYFKRLPSSQFMHDFNQYTACSFRCTFVDLKI